MSDLTKLIQHRDDILRAEIAGWLHNVGKLDPNFSGGAPEKEFQIITYKFERFASPELDWIQDPQLKLMLQDCDEEGVKEWARSQGFSDKVGEALATLCEFISAHGPLYFVSPRRAEVLRQKERCAIEKCVEEQIKQELPKLKKQSPRGYEHLVKRKRQEYRAERENSLDKELEQIYQREAHEENERVKEYRSLMLAIPQCRPWPLPDFLTLFWDHFFEKPSNQEDYDPGSDNDPDYHREYILTRIFGPQIDASLPSLLILAHGEISGQEKYGCIEDKYRTRYEKDPNRKENLSQYNLSSLRLSTAFGYEGSGTLDWSEWMRLRRNIFIAVKEAWENPCGKRSEIYELIKDLRKGVSDTRLPFNEIDLFQYADSIAALFKTAFVQAVLTERVPTPADMHWRLASIRLNAFDFLLEVNQLADLISRQKLLEELWNTIRTALEVETPIGSAIYRDEHGLVFVLPKGLSESGDELRQIIESRIREVILNQSGNLIGATDLRPIVQMGPPRRGKKLLLGEALCTKEPPNMPDLASIQNYWSNYQNQERCHVCGLRPVGYMEDGLPYFVTEEKAKERNLCGVCLARRGRRSEEWATRQGFKETIWIDEVADNNGRVALIVGRFDLDDWLNGNLVRSLAIGTAKEVTNWLAKLPTFARIQRVWRTTAEFWQEVREDVLSSLTDDRRRILLSLAREPDLGAYHVYNFDLGKVTMSVVWCPAQSTQGGFLISVENLSYIARQLGAEKDIYEDPAAAAIWIEDFLKKEFVKSKRKPVLRNPERASTERWCNLLAGNRIVDTNHQNVAYSTAISILAEPRTFMALVPADKALEVVKAIKIKYEREMGKVHNRLPLHLGLVFAPRHMPLRAILDAGKQMLKQKALGNHDTWTVKSIGRGVLPSEKAALADGSNQFNCTLIVKVEQNGRSLTWYVPLKMGDGETMDLWYPYVFWKRDADGHNNPLQAGRNRVFQGLHPEEGRCWLVHADELREGDQIHFAPATFDFEWLDTNARRFEIVYEDCGQRHSRPSRPYLLDDLDRLEALWDTIKNLNITQRYQVIRTIEETRQKWYGLDREQESWHDPVFRQFVADTLAGAAWRKNYRWTDIERDQQEKLIEAGVKGELADLAELYMEILKE